MLRVSNDEMRDHIFQLLAPQVPLQVEAGTCKFVRVYSQVCIQESTLHTSWV